MSSSDVQLEHDFLALLDAFGVPGTPNLRAMDGDTAKCSKIRQQLQIIGKAGPQVRRMLGSALTDVLATHTAELKTYVSPGATDDGFDGFFRDYAAGPHFAEDRAPNLVAAFG